MGDQDLGNYDQDGADFSHLPDVTWVRILQYLSLQDRYHVSVTCRALHEVFKHPSLWHTQVLHLIGHSAEFPDPAFKSSLFDSYLNVTRYFGKYFQNLTLKVNGHLTEMQNELRELLQEVSENCRLETLTIDVGVLTSDFHQMYVVPPSIDAILALSSFVKNAFRLRHLHIRAWPMYEELKNEEYNIFKAITLNDKLVGLETLTLFMVDNTSWTEREPRLLTPESTYSVLKSFRNLTHIGLRTPMINEDILSMLVAPDRAKLERLDLFVHYLDPIMTGKDQFKIPHVSSKVWEALRNRNPDFRVHITVFLPTEWRELANLWKPELPVASITFMRYSEVNYSALNLMRNHNCDTLVSFKSYCNSQEIDGILKILVTNCPNLVEFIYHGEIQLETVKELACARGESWKKFEVLKDKIKVPGEFDNISDDQVLAPDRHGNLVLVALLKHHRSEEDEQEAVDEMSAEVSKALGYAWKPSTL